MPNYKKMYAILCAAGSEALDLLPDTEENREGREVLQRALYRAEEMYIAASGDDDEAG